MDILSRAAATYGMSAILLLSILLATKRKHSPATSRFFRALFYGTIPLELARYIAGWDSLLYTYIYIPYNVVIVAAALGVVWEAYREPS